MNKRTILNVCKYLLAFGLPMADGGPTDGSPTDGSPTDGSTADGGSAEG